MTTNTKNLFETINESELLCICGKGHPVNTVSDNSSRYMYLSMLNEFKKSLIETEKTDDVINNQLRRKQIAAMCLDLYKIVTSEDVNPVTEEDLVETCNTINEL